MHFVNADTLQVILFESYADELVTILESAYKKDKFQELILKKTKFEALDQSNIRNPNVKFSVEEIFKKTMEDKLEAIGKLKAKNLGLSRLEKYVKKQLYSSTFDITMEPPVRYEETAAAVIEDQINKQLKEASKDETNIEENSNGSQNEKTVVNSLAETNEMIKDSDVVSEMKLNEKQN